MLEERAAVTESPGRNNQMDAGLNIGVTSGADDWQPFLGISCRF